MHPTNHISERGKKKLQLYTAAMFLFDQGKSHPQIIHHLNEYESETELVTEMVDKAMREEWDKLYLEAKDLYANDLTYDSVLKAISLKESDLEIAKWICGEWYVYKTIYADCLIEGPTNRFEGIKWIVISALGLGLLFITGASWIAKGVWILALAGSIIQWIVGLQQRSLSRKIGQLFTNEIKKDHEN